MKHEDLERVKACRRDPKMKQADVPSEGSMDTPFAVPVSALGGAKSTKPGFLHTDSGVVFGSRSALKKAIRIAWGKPNTLRQVNKDRLHRALNQIIRANDMSIPEMVKAEIKRNVDRSAEAGAIQSYLQQMIQTEVQKALGSKAQIEQKVKGWALAEAQRLVCEGMSLDFKMTGEAYTRPPGSGRALRLAVDPE